MTGASRIGPTCAAVRERILRKIVVRGPQIRALPASGVERDARATIPGRRVLQLIQDVLWSGLAVAISGGLLFGTVMTMVFVPTLYAIVFRIRKGKGDTEPESAPAAAQG